MDKLHLDRPVIVEGKYDKIKLSSVIDTEIIVTDGFGVFKRDERAEYILRIADEKGIIILTDSDHAGMMIRNYLKGRIPAEKITNVYIPQIKGKEKRKTKSSAEGLLGVEGIDTSTLRAVLADFCVSGRTEREITSVDLYNLGLSGGTGSREKREKICSKLGLPKSLSSSEFLDAVNMLVSKDELVKLNDET
ncbi:MAG: DUF4093 domain-containing protein [Firmicutes bacterium]|nr:DUF4093 domain-containing protein [Candidatus Colimorpha enterica]